MRNPPLSSANRLTEERMRRKQSDTSSEAGENPMSSHSDSAFDDDNEWSLAKIPQVLCKFSVNDGELRLVYLPFLQHVKNLFLHLSKLLLAFLF